MEIVILFTILLYIVFFIRDIKEKILWKKKIKRNRNNKEAKWNYPNVTITVKKQI